MIAYLYLLIYLACGVMIVRWLLPRHTPVARAWLGACLGLLMMMWLPALCAFALNFTWQAHAAALLPLAGLTAGAYALRDRRAVAGWDDQESRLLRQCLWVVIPLTILSGYLQSRSVRVSFPA